MNDSGTSPQAPIEIGSLAAESVCGLKHKFRLTSDPEAPLILMVHGRAGSFDVMWTFRRAIPEQWNAIAPQAPIPDTPDILPKGTVGYSWWEVLQGSRGEPEAMQRAASKLAHFLDQATTFYRLRPKRVVAIGFSQGAALLSVMAQRPDQPFAGIGLLAGFVIRNSDPTGVRTCPVQMCHGERDEVVPFDLAKKGAEHLRGLGFPVEIASDPVGHKIGPAGVRALKSFLEQFA